MTEEGKKSLLKSDLHLKKNKDSVCDHTDTSGVRD